MADARQLSAAIIVALICKKRNKKRKAREFWERERLRRRWDHRVYGELLQELRLEDVKSYRKYLRMDTVTFKVSLNSLSFLVLGPG